MTTTHHAGTPTYLERNSAVREEVGLALIEEGAIASRPLKSRLDSPAKLVALEVAGGHQGARGHPGKVAARVIVHGGAATVGAQQPQVSLHRGAAGTAGLAEATSSKPHGCSTL